MNTVPLHYDYVGSFLRPEKLKQARKEYAEGTISALQLKEIEDACIIDLLMADAMIGEGTSYPDLATAAKLSSEQYGVGFRKGSDLAEKLNAFFVDAYADGSMQTCADQYKIGASLIEQK